MIRGVTVDWWHTIVEPHGGSWEEDSKRDRCEGIRRVLDTHGIPSTYERIDVAYDLWTDHLKRAWKSNVDWSADQQLLDLLASAGFDGVADRAVLEALREPIGAPLVNRPPEPHPDAIETLRALKSRGLRIGLISNTGRTWGAFLRKVQDRLGISDLFDVRTFSDEERVRKPDARIFRRTLASLRLGPDEVVHVGDDLDADVRGAKRAGMRVVWYDAGTSPGFRTDEPDAMIHAWTELPEILEAWQR